MKSLPHKHGCSGIRLYSLSFIVLLWSCAVTGEDDIRPEDNRFSVTVLAENLDQPMQMDMLLDGRVIFVEREGAVRVYDPVMQDVITIAVIPVSSGYYDEDGKELSPVGEDGMQGVVLDPNFEKNSWIYLFYSPKEGNSGSVLTRYTWTGDSLDMSSKKILLEVPNQRISCCHLGGGMVFDKEGNLYLSTGDNSPNDPRGFNPIDERPGQSRFDAQRSSGNTNDLRGKILRIHPEDDGTYTIPEGNLFPVGTPKTRPEIFTMGNRNPYRLSIDSKTGWLFWGEVGPAGIKDSVGFGPKSYEEFNIAKKAGNYGWPFVSGNNAAYWKYDYEKGEPGSQFDPMNLRNESPNNTGLVELPPAVPALIWYPQKVSTEFPIPGSGSASALGGPIFREMDFDSESNRYPSYYEGKWFVTDWAREWIMVVTLNDEGEYVGMERFLPDLKIVGPNDMKFGPDGNLYVLEYGRGPYINNEEARLIRIEYNEGNREPVVKATVNKTAFDVPFELKLSSSGTIDYDGDQLSYDWEIHDIRNGEVVNISESDAKLMIEEAGEYEVDLYVDDGHHLAKSETIKISAGNEPPLVNIDLQGMNSSFSFGQREISYRVEVSDKEDGNLADGGIDATDVKFDIDSIRSDIIDIARLRDFLGNENTMMPITNVIGKNLMERSDCNTCHRKSEKLMGPSFLEVKEKYGDRPDLKSSMISSILSGSVGAWGEEAMPGHPTLTEKEASSIVEYILNIDQLEKDPKSLQGTVDIGNNSESDYYYIFRASYQDKGSNGVPSVTSKDMVILSPARKSVTDSDEMDGMVLKHYIGKRPTVSFNSNVGYFSYRDIDLTEVGTVELRVNLAGLASEEFPDLQVTLRKDSPNGLVIGKSGGFDRLTGNNKWNTQGYLAVKIKDSNFIGNQDLYFVIENLRGDSREYELLDVLFGTLKKN